MPQDLRIESSDAGPFLKIQVSGTLNEALVPESFAGIGDGRPIRIDLEKVSRITSFGVRQWVRSLEGLSVRSGGLVLERCSYACVSQLNLISTFSADALVMSVMAPLRCEACEHEEQVVVDVSRGPPGSLERPCTKCGAKAELEEDPDSYFAFAKSRPLTNGLEALFEKLRTAVVGESGAPQALALPQTQAQPTTAGKPDETTAQPPRVDDSAKVELEKRAAPEAERSAATKYDAQASRDGQEMTRTVLQARARAEVTPQAMVPPPPPPIDDDFDTSEETVVHFIEDIADYVPTSQLVPERAQFGDTRSPDKPAAPAVTARPPAAPLIDWSELDQRITRWVRRRSAIAFLAFGLGLLLGFFLGRL